eukprot:215974_1
MSSAYWSCSRCTFHNNLSSQSCEMCGAEKNGWKDKEIKKWSNNDLVDWINSIGLSNKWQDTMIEAIKNTGCTGQDWFAVKNGKDLANLFDIKQPMIANRVYREFKKVYKESVKKHGWKDKEIKKWSNNDLVDWINSIGLSNKWQDTMIEAIKNTGCTGQDWFAVKNGKDLANLFDIKQPMIANRVYREFKKVYKESVKKHGWKDKEIKKWSNNDLVDWIKSIGLLDKWQDIMVEAIENTSCTGQNWFAVKNAKDLANLFDIKQPMIANRVYREFQKVKEKGPKQKEEEKGFELQLFGQSKYWKVPQKVNPNTTVRRVKKLYRAESGVESHLDTIILISKAKILPNHATLGQCGITNERHLITVKFSTGGAAHFKETKIKKWTNRGLCGWIKSIGLSDKWQDMMIQTIENTECTGKDWVAVQNGKDLANLFDIKQPVLANRVYGELEKVKEEELVLRKKLTNSNPLTSTHTVKFTEYKINKRPRNDITIDELAEETVNKLQCYQFNGEKFMKLLLHKMGEKGMIESKEFGWEVIYNENKDFYDENEGNENEQKYNNANNNGQLSQLINVKHNSMCNYGHGLDSPIHRKNDWKCIVCGSKNGTGCCEDCYRIDKYDDDDLPLFCYCRNCANNNAIGIKKWIKMNDLKGKIIRKELLQDGSLEMDILCNMKRAAALKSLIFDVNNLPVIKRRQWCLFAMDLDHLKCWNDCLGHVKADVLIQNIGNIMKRYINDVNNGKWIDKKGLDVFGDQSLREGFIYRTGGDEFVAVIKCGPCLARADLGGAAMCPLGSFYGKMKREINELGKNIKNLLNINANDWVKIKQNLNNAYDREKKKYRRSTRLNSIHRT